MFKFWNNRKEKKLQKKYEKLMEQGYQLSTVNRKLSDEKYVEANEILKQIENFPN